MIQDLFIMIPALLVVLFEIFALGKMVTKSNIGFIRNDLAIFSIGFSLYLAITFAVFTPFIFIDKLLEFSDVYFVIVFAIKEVLLLFVIFTNNELNQMMKSYNIQTIIYMFVAGVIIMIVYNYSAKPQDNVYVNDLTKDEAFFSWNWEFFKVSLRKITTTDNRGDFVLDWGFSIIVGMYMYGTLGSFLRKYMHLNYFGEFAVSTGLSLMILYLMNDGRTIADLSGIITSLFAIFIALNLIEHSRRRFGVLYTVTFIVAWTIDYELLLSLSFLSISVFALYIIFKKPMIPLFGIQLMSPLVFALTILLTRFWVGIPFLLNLVLMPLYLYFVTNSRSNFFDKIHNWMARYNWHIVGSMFLIIVTLFITSATKKSIDWHQAFVVSIAITSISKAGIIVSAIAYYLMLVTLIALNYYMFWVKAKFVKVRLAASLLLVLILLFFNPFTYIALSQFSWMERQFSMIQHLVYIPTILIVISMVITFFFSIDFSDKKKMMQKFKINRFRITRESFEKGN